MSTAPPGAMRNSLLWLAAVLILAAGTVSLAAQPQPDPRGALMGQDPQVRAAYVERDQQKTEAQAHAFEKAITSAHVVRLAHADHYVFRSNEADVLREMAAFIATLPR